MNVLTLGSQNAKLILLQNVTKTLLLRAQHRTKNFPDRMLSPPPTGGDETERSR